MAGLFDGSPPARNSLLDLAQAQLPPSETADDRSSPLPYPPPPRPRRLPAPLSAEHVARLETDLQHPNVKAFLTTISEAEGGAYNRLYGFKTFDDYSKHPGYGLKNSAAGRYQILAGTHAGLSAELGLKDFSPHTQDLMAVRLLESTGALNPLLTGNMGAAISAAAPQWNSLEAGPGQGNHNPGQTFKTYDWIVSTFERNLERELGR